MQIPARTNSAPPNLDEQKRDQARHDSSSATPMFPIPAVPKQQTTRKDGGVADQSNTGEAHQMSKARGDAQIMSALPVTQTQKASVHPIPGVSMPMPFHHPQAPVQFGGANPPIQSRGMSAASLPMPFPMGNPPQLQQQVFVPSLQPHPMQPQGIMHQGPSLNFTPQMGPQLPPQLGNLGISISLQFTQQQVGKFGAMRIPVKITHPDTHEESRLDRRADMYRDVGPSGPRSRPTVTQSQPLTSVPPPHPINYYPNSYNPNSLYFSGPSSVPLASNQINPSSQAPRLSYPVSQGPHTAVSFMTPSAHNSYSNNYSSLMHGIAEPSSLELPRDIPNATSSAPSPSIQVTVMHSHATGFQKGLIPSPQTPLPVMHKAEKKYEVGQVTDQEEAKQRQLKAILNKLMPQNFEKLFEQVKAVNIDNVVTLTGVISQIFDKALMEPTFCEMYANLCYHLAGELPDFSEDNEKITFKRLLLNKCQEEFERDAREQEEADRADQEGEVKQSEQEREEKRIKARRRMLGKIRLLGELYKKKMLTERIMHGCIQTFLGQYQNPDEEDIEALCILMSTIGEMIDHPKAKENMDAYFDMMAKLSNNMKLSSRLRFMLKDSIDLRKNKWQQRRKVEAVKSYSQQAILNKQRQLKAILNKQRQLRAILNKPMPQNFEKLFEQVKAVNIDNVVTLTGVISQIFDKALMEPTFCEMYANLCYHLAGELPDFSEDNEKITFKRLLLNKCQEEFERDAREQEEADRADQEGEVKQSEQEREEKRIKAQRRMLGNVRLIGELYKKKMLTERIMHECIKKLLGQYQNPDEEDIEALCILMSTIGEMIDHPNAKEHMDAYFDMMAKLSNSMKLSLRLRFMLKDSIDLRKNKWQQRQKVEGPKKIEEVHRDAAQEWQVQAGRLTRGPGVNTLVGNHQPMDFGPRGSSMFSSANAHIGSLRGLPTQLRGFGTQDSRFDDRHPLENRTLSVPLPQRLISEDSITLGPQGGLARGMSIRGQPSMTNIPSADAPSPGDSRRMATGLNGYSSVSDRTVYGREDPMPRYIPDRFPGSHYEQPTVQDGNVNHGNKDPRSTDRSSDRSLPTSPTIRGQGPTFTQNNSSNKVWPEDRLRDMSIATIKEFYSANDEKEVALCVKDLNSPSFYPTMISIWVTDSFERKDMERDLLAKLLINLSKPRDGMLNQDHLIKGFESVLSTLEDAVNDAPKAGEFLGRILAKVVSENVLTFTEVGQLIYEGGEEQGSLVEIGLAAEVVGTILETIKSEKGESVMNEIRRCSSLKLEKFRPPDAAMKSWRLDKFI